MERKKKMKTKERNNAEIIEGRRDQKRRNWKK